jgi:endonuclease III
MTTKAVGKELAALARDLLRICEALEARYGCRKSLKPNDFIEALVFQILELGTSEKAARDALRRLREEYVDWNDARVATVREIEDILGAKYYQVREKAEDIRHLLADFYTAFRTMNLGAQLTPEGVETLLALPETTNVRKDMVERALVLCHETRIFPCDDDQFRLLRFLGNLFKNLTLQQGQKKVEEVLDVEQMLRLSRGLREHVHTYQIAGEDEPQIIAFNWDQPDPLKMDKGKAKTGAVHKDKPEKAKPEKPKVEKVEKVEKPKVEKHEPELMPTTDRVVRKPAAAKVESHPAKEPAKVVKITKSSKAVKAVKAVKAAKAVKPAKPKAPAHKVVAKKKKK